MARKRDNRNLQKGLFYHFYNRGNWFEDIGFDAEDFQKYVEIMYRYADKYKQHILSYCFMPNHFHLLIKLGEPILTASFFKFFSGGCARFFNKKYKKVGHLFQDKYKHRLISDELDLVYVSRYIHRNPLNIDGVNVNNLIEYPFSSFREYAGLDLDSDIKKEEVLKYFDSKWDYFHFVTTDELSEQSRFLTPKDILSENLNRRIQKDWKI